MSWRGEARAALRAYPKVKRKQSENEQQITPVYGGAAVQHSASRTTEDVALRSTLTDREERIIRAVEFALTMQSKYYNADARKRMIRLVYWARTHTMQGAAMEVGYNINTVKSWNHEILTAIYVAIKKE